MKYQLTILCLLVTIYLQASVIYVNSSATGANDGSSWLNAYTDLQEAISAAVSGDELWIAQGSYYPTSGINRYVYFELKNGVKWYGGFNGTEVNLSDRDPMNNISILSGDIGVLNDSTDNSFTVIYTAYTDSTTVLDGLTIDHGIANSGNNNDGFGSPAKCGGGVYILATGTGNEVRPEIRQCIFSNNTAASYGGGIFYSSGAGGSATPLIDECLFFNNSAAFAGGAISKFGGNSGTHTISNSTFLLNSSVAFGGAIHSNDTHGQGVFVIDSCSFDGNSGGAGGAIYIEDYNDLSDVKIVNSSFTNSKSLDEGLAILLYSYDSTSDFKIIGCDFIENRDSSSVDLVSFLVSSFDGNEKEIFISNSLFKSNLIGGQGIIWLSGYQPSLLKIFNCSFIENEVSKVCISVRPYGSKCYVKNNLLYNNKMVSNNGGIFQLSNTSQDNIGNDTILFVENSILWGNISGVNEKYVDTKGNILFKNCLIDVSDCQDLAKDTFDNAICSNVIYNQYPEFVDTTNCDLRLKPCSPAVNTGDNTLLDSTMVFDLLGNPRISEDIVDMGPYEIRFPLSINAIDSVLCYGDATGAVFFDFENGTLPLSYEWGNGQETGVNNTELTSGDYLFTVTDAAGCSRAIDLSISQSDDLQITSSLVDASSSAQSDGEILLTSISGGASPYNYIWSNGADSQSIDGLLAGVYDLTITDGNDCEYFFTFEVDFTIAVSRVVATESIWSYPGTVKPGGDFSFYMDSPNDAKIELIMLTTLGEKVYQYHFEKTEKDLIKTLSAPNQSGLYFITILVNGVPRKVLHLSVIQ